MFDVMVNFMCRPDCATGCPDIWSNVIPSISVFLDKFNIETDRLAVPGWLRHLPLDPGSGRDLRVVGLSPMSGSILSVDGACLRFSLPLPLYKTKQKQKQTNPVRLDKTDALSCGWASHNLLKADPPPKRRDNFCRTAAFK